MEEEDYEKECKTMVDHGEAMMTLHKREGDYEEDTTLFFPRSLMSSKRTAAAIEKEQKVRKLELEQAKKPGKEASQPGENGGKDEFAEGGRAAREVLPEGKPTEDGKVTAEEVQSTANVKGRGREEPVVSEPGETGPGRKDAVAQTGTYISFVVPNRQIYSITGDDNATALATLSRDTGYTPLMEYANENGFVDGTKTMFTGGGAHDPCAPYCSSYLLVDIKTGRDFRFGVTENISDVLQKFHMKLSGCRRNWMVHCFVSGFLSRKDASDFRKVWKLHVEIIQDSYDIDCDAVLRVAASELYHHWNRYERELTVTLSQCKKERNANWCVDRQDNEGLLIPNYAFATSDPLYNRYVETFQRQQYEKEKQVRSLLKNLSSDDDNSRMKKRKSPPK